VVKEAVDTLQPYNYPRIPHCLKKSKIHKAGTLTGLLKYKCSALAGVQQVRPFTIEQPKQVCVIIFNPMIHTPKEDNVEKAQEYCRLTESRSHF